ncbi:ATP-binding protein [Micromonospora coerulea]|uniref:ATP-binding protein n=1 Tax=Micromonospora coerulea TaxID=47856 RepID=UPI0019075923|nr:ATP-binding protein [Micromonospora veneta]
MAVDRPGATAEPDPPAPSTTPEIISYAEPTDLKAVRAFVCSRALARGLPTHRVELLALAVSELATNTLQHCTGGGWVRLWAETGRLVCEVVDQGPVRALGRSMPAADAVRGRGLAIVERICDEVSVSGGPSGTVVRIRLAL